MKKTIKLLIFGMFLLVLTASGQIYNDTALDDADDIYEQTVALNTMLNGLVGYGFLLVVFSISFVLIQTNTANMLSALTGAGYFTTFSALIFLPLGSIGWSVFQVILIIFALSLAARVLIK
jgi:hypothetical protein